MVEGPAVKAEHFGERPGRSSAAIELVSVTTVFGKFRQDVINDDANLSFDGGGIFVRPEVACGLG